MACGAAVVGVALLAPGQRQIMPLMFVLLLIPQAVQIGLTLTRRRPS